MRRAGGAVLVLLLAVACAAELRRYAAERRLRAATDAFRAILASPPGAAADALERIADLARSAASGLPHDPRPYVLGGSARLVARRPVDALELYGRAFATGERAEIDLNIGRARGLQADSDGAAAAHLRALWISPALAPSLPPEAAQRLLAEVRALEEDLRRGRLVSPPPPPE